MFPTMMSQYTVVGQLGVQKPGFSEKVGLLWFNLVDYPVYLFQPSRRL